MKEQSTVLQQHNDLLIELTMDCYQKCIEIGYLLVPALCAVRAEMDFPINVEVYRELMERTRAEMEHSVSSFIENVKSQSKAVLSTETSMTLKTLNTSKLSYETAMRTAADLYAKKIIDEQMKAEVIRYGHIYMTAHNQAVEIMAAGGQGIEAQLHQVNIALADLLEVIGPYLAKEENLWNGKT